MARQSPKARRSMSARDRFEKEEELARERRGRFPGHKGDLHLVEETPKHRIERTIAARQYGPALRTAKKVKKK